MADFSRPAVMEVEMGSRRRMHHTEMNEYERWIEYIYLNNEQHRLTLLLSNDQFKIAMAEFLLEVGKEFHDELVTAYAQKRAIYESNRDQLENKRRRRTQHISKSNP